jgi:hypothetical protein
MKKLISSLTLVALIGMIVAVGAGASDTGSVAATVTGEVVAVTVEDGTVAYGTLSPNDTENTVTLVDTQVVTNTGNVAEDFTIKGTDVEGGWDIGPAADEDIYFHGWCIDLTAGCDAEGEYTAMTNGYTAFVSNKAAAGHTDLDLWIHVPTVNTKTAQQAVNVDILATEH